MSKTTIRSQAPQDPLAKVSTTVLLSELVNRSVSGAIVVIRCTIVGIKTYGPPVYNAACDGAQMVIDNTPIVFEATKSTLENVITTMYNIALPQDAVTEVALETIDVGWASINNEGVDESDKLVGVPLVKLEDGVEVLPDVELSDLQDALSEADISDTTPANNGEQNVIPCKEKIIELVGMDEGYEADKILVE